MRTAIGYLAQSPDTCWRSFTDPQLLGAWVPGLRRTRVVVTGGDGLASEILFEFAASLTYTLVYSYDPTAREVRWEPRAGKRDAVRGFARFDAFDSGTRMTYGLEQGDGRSEVERALGEPANLVEAFTRWLGRDHRT